jgi:hypothetical protein
MNLKVAHLISIQFGIFIGIVCCLAFSRFGNLGSLPAADKRAPVTKRAAAVEPLARSEEQPGDIADNGTDPEEAEPIVEQPSPALPNEYSPEAVERYRAEATRLYYEQIAPRRTTTTVTTVTRAYTKPVEEPAIDQTYDPAPETVAYVQPTQVIVYPQPVPFAVFSQSNRHRGRRRPVSPPGAIASNPNRPLSAVRHPSGSPGLAHHRNTGGSSCAPTHGSNPQGTR